jgi:N4-gp56 family major capsid protein
MATTNFAALTAEQYTVWSRQFWREARNKTFLNMFTGSTADSMVQRITELKQTTDGARAVITMVNDAQGDGVVGDNQLKGNEEALQSTEDVIQLDQWRHAHRSKGKMAEQKSIVNFRNEAKDKLSYTAARVADEIGFLTLAGVSLAYHTDGSPRVGSQLPQLKFAADIAPPSAKRHLRWDVTSGLVQGDTTAVDAADTITWATLVDLKAAAMDKYIRPLRSESGVECFNVFMTPKGIARLKKDKDYLAAVQYAQKRGDDNPLFAGTAHGGKQGIYIDGLNILEYRNVYNTTGAASGSKWGAGGTVDGERILLCGAQALAYADIGTADWEEDYEDYGNSLGIAVGKIFGFLKPQLFSIHAQSKEDFGVLALDVAL